MLLVGPASRTRATGAARAGASLEAGAIGVQPIMITTTVSMLVLGPVAFFP